MTRCDNCGRRVGSQRDLHDVGRFQGRHRYVCGHCLETLTQGIVQAIRAAARREAA